MKCTPKYFPHPRFKLPAPWRFFFDAFIHIHFLHPPRPVRSAAVRRRLRHGASRDCALPPPPSPLFAHSTAAPTDSWARVAPVAPDPPLRIDTLPVRRSEALCTVGHCDIKPHHPPRTQLSSPDLSASKLGLQLYSQKRNPIHRSPPYLPHFNHLVPGKSLGQKQHTGQ